MIVALKAGAVFAAVALGLPTAFSGAPVSAAPADATCTASVKLPSVLVLSQSETERHPVLTTSCPLDFPDVTILTSSDQPADSFDWTQDPVTSGDPAVWDQYNFDYVVGETYHTDQSSSGLYEDPNPDNSDQTVTIASSPMTVTDYSSVSLSSARRHKGTVTITGTTRQWSPTANYGEGAIVRGAEVVTIERQQGTGWLTVKTARSSRTGAVVGTLHATAGHTYRLVIGATRTLAPSTSGARRA
jgi:hypothetical protein